MKNELIRARIDAETKKKIMFVVKAKGNNLSQIIREALEEYAKKNS